jgi:hypothetical protein
LFGEREAEREGGAGAGGVAGEIAAMEAGDAAGDGEAEFVSWAGSRWPTAAGSQSAA